MSPGQPGPRRNGRLCATTAGKTSCTASSASGRVGQGLICHTVYQRNESVVQLARSPPARWRRRAPSAPHLLLGPAPRPGGPRPQRDRGTILSPNRRNCPRIVYFCYRTYHENPKPGPVRRHSVTHPDSCGSRASIPGEGESCPAFGRTDQISALTPGFTAPAGRVIRSQPARSQRDRRSFRVCSARAGARNSMVRPRKGAC
jgi:hypothetical protein